MRGRLIPVRYRVNVVSPAIPGCFHPDISPFGRSRKEPNRGWMRRIMRNTLLLLSAPQATTRGEWPVRYIPTYHFFIAFVGQDLWNVVRYVVQNGVSVCICLCGYCKRRACIQLPMFATRWAMVFRLSSNDPHAFKRLITHHRHHHPIHPPLQPLIHTH